MTVRQPRYSKEGFAQRGDFLYESEVRTQVEEGNHGRIVAIASRPARQVPECIRAKLSQVAP
jgi:hypothetical protein